MNDQPRNNPPIGRYIFIAFIFVLLFIGTSFLVYRFSRNSAPSSSSINSTPTPATGSTTGPSYQPPISSGYILPAPRLTPINPIYRTLIPNPYTNLPLVKTAPDGRTIAQDGNGNLLFDNLTHVENAQLQLARIDSSTRLKSAEQRFQYLLRSQELSNQFESQTQKSDREFKLAAQEMSLIVERLEAQISTKTAGQSDRLDNRSWPPPYQK